MTTALAWLSAFFVTEVIETPIYASFVKRGVAARIAIGFGASAITHPFVWFVFPRLFDAWLTYFVVAEIFAIVVEALYLRAFRVPRALYASVLANGASVLVGLSSRAIFGWP